MKTIRLMQSSRHQIDSSTNTARARQNPRRDDLLMKHVTRNGTATEQYVAFKKYL